MITSTQNIHLDYSIFQRILKSVPALVAYINTDLTYRYANAAYHNWFGHDPDSLSGRRLIDVMGSEAFEPCLPYMKQALTGLTVHFEQELKYSGQKFHVDATYIPDIDDQGIVQGFISHVNDITENKILEKNLENKTSELQDYLDNATIALHWVNEDGIIIWANNAEFEMMGYPAEEYIGRNISDFHTDKDALNEVFDYLKNKQPVNKFETQLICKDGSLKTVLISSSALWENDKFIHTRCFTIDITEKRNAEIMLSRINAELEEKVKVRTKKLMDRNAALMRSEERYYKMVDEVQDYAITLLDKNGLILNWNTGAEKIKGYKAHEILGKHFSVFFTPDDLKANLPLNILNKAVKEGKADYEGWRVKKGGELIWAYTVVTALHGRKNEIIGFSKVTRDLTERKLADDKLKQYAHQLEIKNKELEQFAYIVSHDLQEPLRKITTFNKILLSKETDNLTEKGKDYLKRSVSAADRMSALIEDLLNYSRTTSYHRTLEKTNLNDLISDVINTYKEKIDEGEATIEVEDLPAVNVIPFQFKQLINNLFSNSLKYKDEEKKLHITVKGEIKKGIKLDLPQLIPVVDYFHMSFDDNGIGFEDNYKDLIFEIFQRLHNRYDYPGTGIGLAICKKIVQNHNGFITATGNPGMGARFDIFVPVS